MNARMSKGEGDVVSQMASGTDAAHMQGWADFFSFSLFLHHGRSLTICYGMIQVWLLFNNIEEVKKTYL